jgi:endonuclease YncB( thermonuclease family)
MLRRALALTPVLALLAGLLTLLASSPAQAIADRDCSDFATQKAAQIFFLQHSPGSDPHRLDAEGDGIACESNPCPCYYKRSLPSGGGATTPPRRTIVQYARVIKVVDGDTADVRLTSGAKRRVRFLGIDTPEVYGGVECGGPAASRTLKRLLPVRTRVKLVSDTTQANSDRYGRILRYVVRTRGALQVNRNMVWRGHATVYVFNNKPFKRVTSFRAAQRSAKAAPRGIWKSC